MKKIKIQIGISGGIGKGYIGLDWAKELKPKVLHQLEEYPYPFKDNQVQEVIIGYYLCSVKNLMPFFNEMYRIMKKGGEMKIAVPYYASARSHQDPTHLHKFTEYSFAFYNKEWRKQNGFSHYPITADFDIVNVNHGLAATEKGKAQDAIAYNMLHQWNIVHDMMVLLKKR